MPRCRVAANLGSLRAMERGFPPSPTSAKRASLLLWVLLHPCLQFQFLDSVRWCQQTRGTQQGSSHSPTLFGRIVAARFAELNDQWKMWKLQGEIPPYRAGLLLLWVLWFIDDSVLLFRNAAQMTHLMPSVLTLFGSMGLRINITKSCILGARCRLPGTLFGGPHCWWLITHF